MAIRSLPNTWGWANMCRGGQRGQVTYCRNSILVGSNASRFLSVFQFVGSESHYTLADFSSGGCMAPAMRPQQSTIIIAAEVRDLTFQILLADEKSCLVFVWNYSHYPN